MTKTIEAFNVSTQKIETATIVFDSNNEFLVKFDNGEFIKMPGSFTAADIKQFLAVHEQENKKTEQELQLMADIAKSESVLDEL